MTTIADLPDSLLFAVHDAECRPGCADRPSCATRWYKMNGIAAGYGALKAKPNDVAGARLAMHDTTCIERANCTSREDHARRTQSKRAAVIRKVVKAGAA